MLLFLNTKIEESCIYMNGPLKGKKDTIACLGPGSPCDCKYIRLNDKILKYDVKLIDKIKYEKDTKDRYKLYFIKEE